MCSRHRKLADLDQKPRAGVQDRPAAEPEDLLQLAALSLHGYWRQRHDRFVDDNLLGLAKQCIATALSDLVKWHTAKKRSGAHGRQAFPDTANTPAHPKTGPATEAERNDRRAWIRSAIDAAIAQLEPLDQKILRLRNDDPDTSSFGQIGALIGMNADAVRMRYRRAMQRLRPLLAEWREQAEAVLRSVCCLADIGVYSPR